MPIIYALVARESVVLAEFTLKRGNFTTVTRRILEKIPPNNAKMSYVYDRHVFHYIVEDGITYLCMADEEFGRRLPFAFLEDVKGRFRSEFGDRAMRCHAYELNDAFSGVLNEKMDYYSNNPNADKLTKVRQEIDEVKSIMITNIDRVLDRGEKIDLLVDKTENLNEQSVIFRKSSRKLKHAMWKKNIVLLAVILFVVILLLYGFVTLICGGFTLENCWGWIFKRDDN